MRLGSSSAKILPLVPAPKQVFSQLTQQTFSEHQTFSAMPGTLSVWALMDENLGKRQTHRQLWDSQRHRAVRSGATVSAHSLAPSPLPRPAEREAAESWGERRELQGGGRCWVWGSWQLAAMTKCLHPSHSEGGLCLGGDMSPFPSPGFGQ